MVDTVRSDSQILALLANNSTGQIEPQDERDMFVSLRDRDRFKLGYKEPSAGAVSLDFSRANHWEIRLTGNITSLDVTNVPQVNLAFPSNSVLSSRFDSDVVVRTDNFATDPDGGSTAARMQMPTGGLSRFAFPFDAISGRPYCYGFYGKENGSGSLFNFGISNAPNSGPNLKSTNAAPTASWQLFQDTWTADATAIRWLMVDNRSNTVAFDMLFWAFQVCIGSGLPSSPLISDANGPAGEGSFVRLYVRQDATGNRTFSWPAHWLFETSDPAISTAANARDIIDGYTPDGGGHYLGVHTIKGAV